MAETTSERLGDRVRRLRQELGWKQEDLAAAADLSKSFVSEIESNASQPRGPILVRLARALQASLDYLLTGREGLPPGASTVTIPPELAKAAKRLALPYPHVELVLDFWNSVRGMRRDAAPSKPTDVEWEEFYRAAKSVIEHVLAQKKED